MAVLGGIFILIIGLASLIGPAMVTHGYQEQNLELRESPPSSEHWPVSYTHLTLPTKA